MANPPGYDEMHNYKHPKKVNFKLTLFWVEKAGDPSKKVLDKATELLKSHNLGLDVYPASRSPAMTLKWKGKIEVSPELAKEQALELRKLCHAAYPSGHGRLPVIFAPFANLTGGDPCRTTGWTISGTDWLPFVIVNADKVAADNVTLLHEIGHAGLGGGHPAEKGSETNFMSYGTNRTGMLKTQILKLVKAYFAAQAK